MELLKELVNSLTGTGIAGTSVVLVAVQSESNRGGRYETEADAAGHFKITGMAPGTYRPSGEKEGFASPTPSAADASRAAPTSRFAWRP